LSRMRLAVVRTDPAVAPCSNLNIYGQYEEMLTNNNFHYIALRSVSMNITEIKVVMEGCAR
jgi:hypothetical protein